ncbi:hypothetical protein [Sphingomonas sp. PP-CE-3A-406]|uniref:hypothetical protein n=1 Tax=Sphingomonas sp. PP-CE-3A-406 TaxID=2135659 RepID=UPI001604B113|nr:hypothetical protein [Sphingomonas sp. PP-CE-3A-406]
MISSLLVNTATLLLAVVMAPASGATVVTPAPGSPERTAILKVLHHGDARPEARFRIRDFRVVRNGPRAIAYIQGESEVGAFRTILTQEARMPWRAVWGESDGGSNNCYTGARHYAWVVRLIRTYQIDPDMLFPGVTAQAREIKQKAVEDPEAQCVGDLDGGPGGPTSTSRSADRQAPRSSLSALRYGRNGRPRRAIWRSCRSGPRGRGHRMPRAWVRP